MDFAAKIHPDLNRVNVCRDYITILCKIHGKHLPTSADPVQVFNTLRRKRVDRFVFLQCCMDELRKKQIFPYQSLYKEIIQQQIQLMNGHWYDMDGSNQTAAARQFCLQHFGVEYQAYSEG